MKPFSSTITNGSTIPGGASSAWATTNCSLYAENSACSPIAKGPWTRTRDRSPPRCWVSVRPSGVSLVDTLPRQRLPACAGRFYEGTPERLREQVHALLEPDVPRVAAPAIICPHAGLMSSGAVAGAVSSRVPPPSTAILFRPYPTAL